MLLDLIVNPLATIIKTQIDTASVYKYHYDVVINNIRNSSSMGYTKMRHIILTSTPGYFVMDQVGCIAYIMQNLITAGLKVEYIGSSTIIVDWEMLGIKPAIKSESKDKLKVHDKDALKKIRKQVRFDFGSAIN